MMLADASALAEGAIARSDIAGQGRRGHAAFIRPGILIFMANGKGAATRFPSD
jgi:hypothetical protein